MSNSNPAAMPSSGRSILVFDCRAGVAGDMLTGALVHLLQALDDEKSAGILAKWKTALESLPLDEVSSEILPMQKRGIGAVKFRVHHHEHHRHRGLSDVLKVLRDAALTPGALERATRAFTLLAEAEAAVHQTTVEKVHFHEVGAVDAIFDIASCSILLDALAPTWIVASEVRTGCGTVECAHGEMPVPAPATARLLRGVPSFAGTFAKECATPTGVALLRANVDAFGELPRMTTWAEGYGAGDRDAPHANVVRATWGTQAVSTAAGAIALDDERVVVIETDIDDMTGEDFGALSRQLFAAGALDVSTTTGVGKKDRPMTWVRILGREDAEEILLTTLFDHSTTLGARVRTERRVARVRDVVEVDTAFGPISGKRVQGTTGERFFPESDACLAAANAAHVSLATVRDAAKAAFASALGAPVE